jgi:molecular chaperone DnaK (HSP70)
MKDCLLLKRTLIMSGRLGIDFGTSNTVLALWDPATNQGVPLHIPDYGQSWEQGGERVTVVPSLVHYAEDGRIWIGDQVLQRGLQKSPRTMRWMKRYISQRSPIRIHLDGREITPYQAGQDFLTSVLVFAAQEIDFREEEIALSVPVEAFEHYENWLSGIAEQAGMPRFRLIDEPSAAALGYGAHIQPGSVYLIFDFGGGTMHASVILIEAEERAATGRRCRVLGKAGRDVGGTSIDQWLFQHILKINNRKDHELPVRENSTAILIACQQIKEQLSLDETARFDFTSPSGDIHLFAEFTRSFFEDLLDQHEFFTTLQLMVRQALNDAAERGYREEDIQAALLVGGSSQIPSVQRAVRQMFGRERVFTNRPLDAVARGAAAFVAGVDFYDHIQHDYAIRYVDPLKGAYDYKTIVRRGTTYPTPEPVARLSLKASHDQQVHLGIAIFEIGDQRGGNSALELVFDPTGAARLTQITPHDLEQRHRFWMNENTPTFLLADPPARQGEPRFEVEFSIDANKRLILTARDLEKMGLVLKDCPVVKLT